MRRELKRRCKCGNLVAQGRRCATCTDHKKLYNRRLWRGSENKQGIRQAYLIQHPLCVMCEARGAVVAATEVDHIRPHRGNWELFTAWDNLQALCGPCHARKSNTE